jgi:hypothetical protein
METELATFYALVAGTCFTLVGLWWTVVEARSDWLVDDELRSLAGRTYLSFLLPGLMSLIAQINPANSLIWRSSFVLVAALGIYSTRRLVRRTQTAAIIGPFRRYQWLVSVLYGLILVFGAAPELAIIIGLQPLEVEAILLVLLIILAHGLTWEFMVEAKATKKGM